MVYRVVDKVLSEAVEQGLFDNLPGRGEPLDLHENPHTKPEYRLVHRLLASHGFLLPWMELRKDIEGDIQEFRKVFFRQLRHRSPKRLEWEHTIEKYTEDLQEINKRIRNYNLLAPLPQFHIRLLDPAREIHEIAQLTRSERQAPDMDSREDHEPVS